MAWLVLVVSGMFEAVWAIALSRSEGFTRLVPSVVFLAACGVSMAGLAWAMRTLPVGTSYAVWVGIGAALTVVYGMVTGDEAVSVAKVLLLCGLVNGVLGGVFSRLLSKGAAGVAPASWRAWIRRHPIYTAAAMGLALAVLGALSQNTVYGTGYAVAGGLLSGESEGPAAFGLAKLAATVVSYWAGIPGGIFTPALTTGAGIGQHLWELSGGEVDRRVLVLISMAGGAFRVRRAGGCYERGCVVLRPGRRWRHRPARSYGARCRGSSGP